MPLGSVLMDSRNECCRRSFGHERIDVRSSSQFEASMYTELRVDLNMPMEGLVL